jgi:hypothetical protein
MTAMLLIAFAMASVFTNPASFFVSARLLAIRGSSDTVPLPSFFFASIASGLSYLVLPASGKIATSDWSTCFLFS